MVAVNLSGAGTLAVATQPGLAGSAAFSGEGTLAVVAERVIRPEMTMSILDDTVRRAPSPVTVVLVEGFPETDVVFKVDGIYVYTARTDSDGYLSPTSINIPEDTLAGVHTLTGEQTGAETASATFTVELDPPARATTVGPDADPIEVPGVIRSNGTRAWVLQDLLPGGLGSWIMPISPQEAGSPYRKRTLSVKTTTTGRPHISEASPAAIEWTFSGLAPDEAFAQKLLDYGAINRRFYVINHRNQAFKVIFTNVGLTPRLRKTYNGTVIDGHDYTVNALVLEQDWQVPV